MPPDMAAAVAAGALPVGVTTGLFAAAALRQAGAEFVFGALTEFVGWYAGAAA